MKRSRLHNCSFKTGVWLLIISVVSLSACARKPFGTPIEGEDYSKLEERFIAHQKRSVSCVKSFDGQAIVQWEHSLDRASLSGYLKVLLPSSLQFSALTPLNQPFFALSSNGSWFQTIDTTKKIFKKGSLRSFAIKHDLPLSLIEGEWGTWLAGSLLPAAPHVTNIWGDSDNRGFWFSVADNPENSYPQEYTLINFDQQKILERAVLNEQGNIEAVIKYQEWQPVEQCLQPMKIAVSGLSFGAEATVTLKDVKQANLSNTDFNLPIPPGYLRQFLP